MGLWGERYVGGGAGEPCLLLELRDSSLPRAFCRVLHPLPSPQHQLHCLGTGERKAQPGEFRDGGGTRSEGDGGGKVQGALMSSGQSLGITPRAMGWSVVLGRGSQRPGQEAHLGDAMSSSNW